MSTSDQTNMTCQADADRGMRTALAACALPLIPQADGGWCRSYVLPEQGLMFAGHFPGHPVLPAVVQILMAQITVEDGLACTLQLAAVTQAKFTAVLTPQTPVALTVRPARTADHWDCTLCSGEVLAAKFQLYLQEVAV